MGLTNQIPEPSSNSRGAPTPPPDSAGTIGTVVTANVTGTVSGFPEDVVIVTCPVYEVTPSPVALAVTITVAVLVPANAVADVAFVESQGSTEGVAAWLSTNAR